MKTLTVLFGLLLSTSSFSRQYIQCAFENTFDRVVINLNGDESTLFMTNGVHLPDEIRILKDLTISDVGENFTTWSSNEIDDVIESVSIKNTYLNQSLSSFFVEFTISNLRRNFTRTYELSCFSSVH